MNYQNIKYEKENHIVTITINRPEVHNCINNETNLELHHAFKKFRDDDDAFVAIYTGAGDKAFSAGWDLNDAAALTRQPQLDQFRKDVRNSEGYCGYTKKFDIFKPIIVAINGYAVAAGLENMLLGDIRICSDDAKFGALERRWNIVAGDGLCVRLPLMIGYARAMELIITGRAIDAQEALNIGLVNEVVPKNEVMLRAKELAKSICELPQGAIRTDKETVIRCIGRTVEEQTYIETEGIMTMFLREDKHYEGAGSFVQKRKPIWENHGI
ncbi:enoyl-CoA hydratase-related protein [Neobacillus sp.]|uniref:enoyl-CoA hydratase/isomerase family protein n=1 Tax=Neobacillus sp. TaxID=2675273 RepID=UPI0028A19B59|nr:enoyl-CoA hydratase-related protein [Neobacillus sp.]